MTEKQFTIVLPASQVDVVLICVGKQPLELVLSTYMNIKTQVEQQSNSAPSNVSEKIEE